MNDLYQLGDYEVDVRKRQIRRAGMPVPLPQKPFEVLLVLIAGAGVVTKDDLMRTVWPDAFVEEANLTQSVFLLRKALADGVSGRRYVVTLPGVGYQLGVPAVAMRTETEAGESGPGRPREAEPIAATGRSRSHATWAAWAAAWTIAVGTAVLGGRIVWDRTHPAPFTNLSIRRLTNSGDVQLTAISPSGKNIALVTKDLQGRESLSVYERHSGYSHTVVAESSTRFANLAFSPDESYIYYGGRETGERRQLFTEYRVPILGGAPKRIVQDVDGPVSFLQGGKRLCFWRGLEGERFAIMSADADSGQEEKTLAQSAGGFPISAVCSPDGERAAVSSEVGGITILDFKTGRRQPFYQAAGSGEIYADLSWEAAGRGLLANVVTPFSLYPALLFISYPGAKRTQITQDLASYSSPSATSGGSMLVARQGDSNTHFERFSLPLTGVDPESLSFPWSAFLGWRSDDEIVGTTATGGLKMKTLASSHETSVQTADGMQFLQPNGCGASSLVAAGGHPPDRTIAIWHMSSDGSDLKQLSSGPEDILPACTPDGKWVVYGDNSFLHHASLWRVRSDGGTPEKISDGSVWFALSHHQSLVAWIESAGEQQSLVIAELVSGKRKSSIPLPLKLRAVRSLTFAPDDKSIYISVQGESSDAIYDVPLDGSAPMKQVEFRGAHLASLMVSPSGKYLGAVTAKPVADAVLFETHR